MASAVKPEARAVARKNRAIQRMEGSQPPSWNAAQSATSPGPVIVLTRRATLPSVEMLGRAEGAEGEGRELVVVPIVREAAKALCGRVQKY